jgi:hypothetical protein
MEVMAQSRPPSPGTGRAPTRAQPPSVGAYDPRFDPERVRTKKDRILSRWKKGEHDLWALSELEETTPSYAASVLQDAGHLSGYCDLFTSPENPVNVYSGELKGKLGFRDELVSQASVNLLEKTYERLVERHDRAGQHHCMAAALTMYNRARATGKHAEAEIFRRWLQKVLFADDATDPDAGAAD